MYRDLRQHFKSHVDVTGFERHTACSVSALFVTDTYPESTSMHDNRHFSNGPWWNTTCGSLPGRDRGRTRICHRYSCPRLRRAPGQRSNGSGVFFTDAHPSTLITARPAAVLPLSNRNTTTTCVYLFFYSSFAREKTPLDRAHDWQSSRMVHKRLWYTSTFRWRIAVNIDP